MGSPGHIFGYLATLAFISAAGGQATDAESWFRQAWQDAAKPRFETFVPGTVYRWEVEWGPPPSPHRAAELRKEVEGKPDHPARQELATLERLLALGGKPPTTSYTLWWVSENSWRLNKSDSAAEEEVARFTDVAVSARERWMHAPQQLTITSLTGTGRAEDLASWLQSMTADLHLLLTEGFGISRHVPHDIESFDASETGWTARTLSATGIFFFSGTWSKDGGLGAVEQVEASPAVPGQWGPMRYVFSRASSSAVVEVQTFNLPKSETSPERISRLTAVESFEVSDMSRLTKVPEAGGDDAIRGAIRVKSIHDHRSGDIVKQKIEEGAIVDERTASGEAADRRWLRYLGVGTLLTLAGLLVYLRMRVRA